MADYDVYRDISQRTGGAVYIGVVGPVRTGKSTFIRHLAEQLILPAITDENERTRVTDELPQSGAGKTVMTTQPSFVPGEPVEISIDETARMSVRVVDCVGFMVEGALGDTEDGTPRMVKTPWSDDPVPFALAAETGTKRVISEHATIGVVMTTDGSICDLPRSAYAKAEERAVFEMKSTGKPFAIVLNTADKDSEMARALRVSLEEKYGVPVCLLNAMLMERGDISELITSILYEFRLKSIKYDIPGWVCALSEEHWLLSELLTTIASATKGVSRLRDHKHLADDLAALSCVTEARVDTVSPGDGSVCVRVDVDSSLFYRVLGEDCGFEITDDRALVRIMRSLTGAKREYDALESALISARTTGYGIVPPQTDEITLAEPELTEQSGKFGVRLKANAPALHIIKVDVRTEVSPAIGSEKQSQELLQRLLSQFDSDPAAIWTTEIFGKPLSEVVREGLTAKLTNVPDEARFKLQETIERIVNEGNAGMLCILL